MEALAAVLSSRLPQGDTRDNEGDALMIATAAFSVTGGYDAYAAEKETAKLEQLERSLRTVATVITSLHPDVRCALASGLPLDEVITLDDGGRKRAITRGAQFLLASLHDLPRQLAPGIANAKRRAKAGHPPGRTNWRAVSVIDECRALWKRRTGYAPDSLNEASPFGFFVKEVFAVLGLDSNPRAAMDAWRRVQSNDEIS